MSLSGAKSQNLIATAILISAVMLARTAEAAPPDFGSRQIVKRGTVVTRYERHHTKYFGDWTECRAYNISPSTVCAVYDVYPVEVLKSGRPVHGTVKLLLGPHVSFLVYAAAMNLFRTQTLQCKLSYAVYRPANYPWC